MDVKEVPRDQSDLFLSMYISTEKKNVCWGSGRKEVRNYEVEPSWQLVYKRRAQNTYCNLRSPNLSKSEPRASLEVVGAALLL